MMDVTPPENYRNFVVACHVEGCENAEIEIIIVGDPDGIFVCGPCGNELTDRKPQQ